MSHLLFQLQDYESQNASQIVTELCGFVTILAGTFLLHKTRDMGNDPPKEPIFQSPQVSEAPSSPLPISRR